MYIITIQRGLSLPPFHPTNETNTFTNTAKTHAYIAMRLRRMRQRVDELLIVGFRKEKHISLLCCMYILYAYTVMRSYDRVVAQ